MYDIILRNGLVLDGRGNAPRRANIAVFSDSIALVTDQDITRARTVIDCTGKYVAPGFIDAHCHTDFLVLTDPKAEARIGQGITTDVTGNCGIGTFPYSSPVLKEMVKDVIGEWKEWKWKDFSSMKRYYTERKIGVNELFLVSHTALRTAVMGNDCRREATSEEIERMCSLLGSELESGAAGFSTGLYYSPCVYSTDEELCRLLCTVKEKGKIFTVHHRSEGNGCYESLRSVLETASRSGVRTEISHLKAIGKKNQGEVEKMIHLIEDYRRNGLDVKFDQYPYTFGSTSLFSLLPPRVLAFSRLEQRMALSLENEREEIKREILTDTTWDSIYPLVGPDDIRALYLSSNPSFNGLSLTEIAGKLGVSDPLDALFDVLRDETGLAVMTDTTETEESLERIMVHPLMCFGTDSLYSSPMPHPRSYHSTVEFLSKYVRDRRLLPLEEGVRRMTGETAERFGIRDRGVIEEGKRADIVVFDYDQLKVNDDNTNSGIECVILNGKIASKDGEILYTGEGRVL